MATMKVNDVRFYTESRQVQLTLSSGNVTSQRVYPMVWLRDSCHCNICYHSAARNYRGSVDDLDVDCSPASVEVLNEGEGLGIKWTDGHVSEYPVDLLQQVDFKTNDKMSTFQPPKLVLWDSNFSVPKFDFQKVLTDSKTMYEWIRTLWKTGFCLLTGAPSRSGQVQEIGNKVAYLRPTVCGKDTFQLMNQINPYAMAFTSGKLGLHIDYPYVGYVPGVQMLHCITQSSCEGGHTLFADGFVAAEKLRTRHPEYFRLLTTVPVDYFEVGAAAFPYDLRVSHKTIQLDDYGKHVIGIAFSQQNRYRMSVHRRLSLEDVDQFYRAYRTFCDILYSPENFVQIKLAEGDIATFHNFRVMHGRNAFTSSGTDEDIQSDSNAMERCLELGYMDWDEAISHARILRRQLNIIDEDDDSFFANSVTF